MGKALALQNEFTTRIMFFTWLVLICALMVMNPSLSLLLPSTAACFVFDVCLRRLISSWPPHLKEKNTVPEEEVSKRCNVYIGCAHNILVAAAVLANRFSLDAVLTVSAGYHIYNLHSLVADSLFARVVSGRAHLLHSIGLLILQAAAVSEGLAAAHAGLWPRLLAPALAHAALLSLKTLRGGGGGSAGGGGGGEGGEYSSRWWALNLLAWATLLAGRVRAPLCALLAAAAAARGGEEEAGAGGGAAPLPPRGAVAVPAAFLVLGLLALGAEAARAAGAAGPYAAPEAAGGAAAAGKGEGAPGEESAAGAEAAQSEEEIGHNQWKIHGECYDLTEFVDRHPGGKTAIELGRGRECTALFESYHPFTNKHLRALRKYARDEAQFARTLRAHQADTFYRTLAQRAQASLKAAGLGPAAAAGAGGGGGRGCKAGPGRALYYLAVAAAFAGAYAGPYLGGRAAGPALLALCGWLCGSFGHDGSHFAISRRRPFLNALGTLGMAPITSPFVWMHQHTYAHHSFTNDFGRDPDLHHFSFLRAHPRYPWVQRYRPQRGRLYVYTWYLFVVLGAALWLPLKALATGTLHGVTDLRRGGGAHRARVIIHIIVFIWAIFIQPCFYMEVHIAIFKGMQYLCFAGLLFGFFSQVNHLDDHSISAAEKKTTNKSWAAMQVETSNNFCPGSRAWAWLSNGLNLQIEHHLFPGVNHAHLPLLRPVVLRTCREFGVDYRSYPTAGAILGATAKYYKNLASPLYSGASNPN